MYIRTECGIVGKVKNYREYRPSEFSNLTYEYKLESGKTVSYYKHQSMHMGMTIKSQGDKLRNVLCDDDIAIDKNGMTYLLEITSTRVIAHNKWGMCYITKGNVKDFKFVTSEQYLPLAQEVK